MNFGIVFYIFFGKKGGFAKKLKNKTAFEENRKKQIFISYNFENY